MREKQISLIYSAFFSFLASIMIGIMIVLFMEYRFFCKQARELLSLKDQYAYYVDLLEKRIMLEVNDHEDADAAEDMREHVMQGLYQVVDEMIEESPLMIDEISAAESSDAPDNDDEYADDSFVIINRHPDYLKQSTMDYIESQELNALMTAIDIDRWSDYTESSTKVQLQSAAKATSKSLPQKKTVRSTVSQSKKAKTNSVTSRRPVKECGFIWPIDGDKFWISSLFGPRKRIDGTWGFHHGVDMAALKGTAVKAARSGVVVEASFQSGYGNTVVIKHSDTLSTRYAHLHTIRAAIGQNVKQAMVIGTVGETGFIRKKGKDGSHLHFEVYEHGKRINPMPCLPRMT